MFDDETFGLPPESVPEIARLQAALEGLAATVRLAAPWTTPAAEELDRQTLDSWLTQHGADETAVEWFRDLARAFISAEPAEMSLLHFLFYLASNAMIDNMAATSGGNQGIRVLGGSHLVSERLAADLGDAVRLGSRVHAVADRDGRVTVSHDGAPRAPRPRAGTWTAPCARAAAPRARSWPPAEPAPAKPHSTATASASAPPADVAAENPQTTPRPRGRRGVAAAPTSGESGVPDRVARAEADGAPHGQEQDDER